METIKSILKPGAKEEDATLYGSEAERAHAGRQTSTVADDTQAARNAQSHLNEPREEPGVLRQLVNPNHDKYNEAQYGPAGSTTAADTLPPSVSADQKLYTKPEAEKKEGGILRQILNPGGSRRDDVAFGQNATTTPPSASEIKSDPSNDQGGIARQILNPSGNQYDETRHGMSSSTTHNTEGLTGSGSTTGTNADSGLSARVYNGVAGHTSAGDRVVNTAAGPRIPGSSITAPGVASAAVNDGTTESSSLAADHIGDRNRVTGGIGSTSHHHDSPMRTVDTAAGSRIPGSSVTAPGLASAAVNDGTTGSSLSGSNTTGTTGSHHHLGRDAGLAGGAGAAGLAGYEASRHTGTTGSHQQGNLPQVHSTGGEFMSGSSTGGLSSGSAGHHGSTGLAGSDGRAGLAGAAGGALDAEGRSRQQVEDGWKPHEHQGHGHHYDGPNLGNEPTPVAGSSSGPHATRIANLLDPHVGSNSGSTTGSSGLGSHSTTHDSHLGRDAALAGGAGAAAGSALGHSSTGPAPNTVGPHSQDWKNVLDPRVTPNMSQQTGGTTGPSSQQTESGRGISHATGDSKVPASVQRAVPEGLERTLPDSIHDTSGSRSGAGAAGAGAAGLAAGSAAGSHHDGTAAGSYTALPHREFHLGTTSDPATQHGVGRDHTTHRDDHSHTGAATGAGVGAAGLAAGSAAHQHHNTTSGTTSGSTSHTTTGQTGSGRGVSHATGDSKVPAGIQRAVPEGLERTLPDSIHDTSGSRTAGAAGAAGVAGAAATHGHSTGTSSTIPQKDFNLGTTSDRSTQHGVGRDHVGGTTAGSTTTTDSEHHEKKQGFISKLLHRHKDDDVATGESNKLHKEHH